MPELIYVIMGFIFKLLLVIFLVFLVYHLLTKKFINPYKLYLFFGKKGSGKSTLLQKLVSYYSKRGYTCYCNIGDCSLKQCISIPIEFLPQLSIAFSDKSVRADLRSKFLKLGYKCPDYVKPKSVIFCDEINLLWDNRDFKSFPKDMQKYFRLQRHYKHIFIGFSQTYDCDKKIRDLADELIIVKRSFRVWIRTSSYVKKVVVVSPDDDNSRDTATMTDDFIPRGIFYDLTSPFNAWLPKWVKVHDSFK